MWERRLRLGHLRIFAVRLVLEVDCDEMRKGENGDRNVFPSSTHFPPPSYHGYNVCKSIHTQNRMAFPFFPISKPRFSPKTLNGIFALEDQEGLSAHLVMWGDRTNTPLPFVISHCVWVLHLLRKKNETWCIEKENVWEALSLTKPSGLCFSANWTCERVTSLHKEN